MTNSPSKVRVEHDGHVGIIRMVDERKRNALSYELREEFVEAFYTLRDDPDVRALYVTGSGAAFCGGGDLRMMREESDTWSSHRRLSRTARWLTDYIRCPKPVVVGVNGVAVGGGIGLALAGDVIYAARENATFMAGFMRLGLIPDVGVMYTLPRAVGMAKARSFVFGNETWTAEQAENYGLINAAVPDDELDAQCLERATQLANGPVEGFGLAKTLLGRSLESSLDEMFTYEDLGQSVAYSTQAVQEGVDALVSGRPADFVAATEREIATQLERKRR
ncbi:enoyl-CoA hydratase/isomerase family protein [Rhodococcus opacus]|uniref:enoyl-CoA hydratase/isomerase family protein n=1 Tax=Rhodococcus opacus TaxID=37919 RepID=UPI001C486D21|nr:enoyl-CoA hydratase/isomerase family protein [Rhodococcus opacus]MBV6756704.1 enoyl-CoA hydratase/isomerase family protein [Rhodococcus opacus]